MTIKTSDLTVLTNRRSELRIDPNYVHIMKYMGSKRELLPDIQQAISSMIQPGNTVLDIFAGTASVGAYLKDQYCIYSNDIQNYSSVISNALIVSSVYEINKKEIESIITQIQNEYQHNREYLSKYLKETLKVSKKFTNIEKGNWNNESLEAYKEFVLSFPSPSNNFNAKSEELTCLTKDYFKKNRSSYKSFPYFQTTFLFSETYFSLEQAISLDSLRYAIDDVLLDNHLHNLFLAALMYAHSYASSGTGHFAMFRELKDLDVVEDTFLYRKRNVWELFEKKINELVIYHTFIPNNYFKTFSLNFTEILDSEIMKNVDLVYADPPYSFVHYSRFYHAVESLILYDYNIPKFKGRYRTDRHQSPFCQKTNVKEAFYTLFEKAKKTDTKILLSYADTAMISLSELQTIIESLGFSFYAEALTYNHSTMGRKGHKNNKINEYLIKAIPRESK